jgi:hypothetical protein
MRNAIKCDWPGCQWITVHPFLDGWSTCASHGDIKFLPDPAVLCPRHGEAYEDLASNPWKLSHERRGENCQS